MKVLSLTMKLKMPDRWLKKTKLKQKMPCLVIQILLQVKVLLKLNVMMQVKIMVLLLRSFHGPLDVLYVEKHFQICLSSMNTRKFGIGIKIKNV